MTNSRRRKGLTVASALLGGVLVLSACSGGDDSASGGGGDSSQAKVDEAAAKKTSEAQIKIKPEDGTDNASINNSAAVTVSKGTLTEVTMTTAEGAAVEGEISADKTSWKPSAWAGALDHLQDLGDREGHEGP